MISDEQLSAFLDGNASVEEMFQVLETAKRDKELCEIIKISGKIDKDMANMKPIFKNIPMTAMVACQEKNYLCDIECEEFILHQIGIETTHKTLLDDAYCNCWLKDKGMPLYNIGRLLEKNNLSVSRRYDSTIEDVIKLLEQGNQLIAVINNSLLDKMENGFDDNLLLPNHAVAISSISIAKGEIILFNPYIEEGLATYNIPSFLRAWDKSNNYLVVINTTDKFVYEPYPINLDDVFLSDELIELQEAIAENAHEIWAKTRIEQGWTYGPKRDDEKKETPDMVPYCNLPESEKLYDREMAMQTLKLVKKLGFEIKKINQEK